MRTVRNAGWLFCGQVLLQVAVLTAVAVAAPPPQIKVEPSYIKLNAGTWAVGGVDDLVSKERSVALFAKSCKERVLTVKVIVGFVIEEDFSTLSVSGAFSAPEGYVAEVAFKNLMTGNCDPHRRFDVSGSRPFAEQVSVDSTAYWNSSTSEVELCLVIRGECIHSSTDRDAVSVQNLTISPTPTN